MNKVATFNYDSGMSDIKAILIQSLVTMRDRIKEICDIGFAELDKTNKFTKHEAQSIVVFTAEKIHDRMIAELTPVFYKECKAIKQKYGNDSDKVLRNLNKLSGREATSYALSITMEKLLDGLHTVLAGRCIESFNKEKSLTKEIATKNLSWIADDVCTQISKGALDTIDSQMRIDKRSEGRGMFAFT